MPDSGWWEALWPEPSEVVSALGIGCDDAVVDLCCGDGWLTLPIARRARHVTAIDLDVKVLETARLRLGERAVKNCTFVEADAYDVAEAISKPADFVLLASAFHGAPDKPRLVRAVWLALKPGGSFGLVNWHPRPRELTRVLGRPRGPATALRIGVAHTIEIVEAGGFQIRNFVDVSPHHYAAIFERVAG